MRGWRHTTEILGRRSTQIAVRLIDDVTARSPIGSVSVQLQAEEAPDEWRDTGRIGVSNASGITTFPGLEQRAKAGGLPARKYRVVVVAAYYRALYPAGSGGLEFMVQPFDDQTPAPLPAAATPLALLPSPTYPFPSHVRVLRGRVRLNGTNEYVPDAVVRQALVERTLSDEAGSFALPLRWPALSGPVTIDATGPGGEAGSVNVVLPGALASSNTIDIA